ncbi:MAG TPA: hypothetical protein VG125_25945 [Pirellulales bacterium]|jgi:hypothetical protein|nr:hypothetical protein [Pirellulales bacterium]
MSRRFQFSLRGLLVVVTLSAGFAWATTVVGFPVVGLATAGVSLIIAAAQIDETLRGTIWPIAVCLLGVLAVEAALLLLAVGLGSEH